MTNLLLLYCFQSCLRPCQPFWKRGLCSSFFSVKQHLTQSMLVEKKYAALLGRYAAFLPAYWSVNNSTAYFCLIFFHLIWNLIMWSRRWESVKGKERETSPNKSQPLSQAFLFFFVSHAEILWTCSTHTSPCTADLHASPMTQKPVYTVALYVAFCYSNRDYFQHCYAQWRMFTYIFSTERQYRHDMAGIDI